MTAVTAGLLSAKLAIDLLLAESALHPAIAPWALPFLVFFFIDFFSSRDTLHQMKDLIVADIPILHVP